MMFFLITMFIIAAMVSLLMAIIPAAEMAFFSWRLKKEKKVAAQFDELFYDKSPRPTVQLYFILPLALGAAGFIFYRSLVVAVLAAVFGLFLPSLMLKIKYEQRRRKFDSQILNAIMILSSSLKGGLSLLQALEVVAEEMPVPMSQEVGLVVRENKMGVPLEDALKHLNNRMNLSELTLLINSILVAKGTGGDLTKVFSRLSTTIRDNRKLRDSIQTLTMQGRMQGMIMSALPFLFIWWVFTFNRNHFDIMLQSETGRILIFVAIFLQVAGMVLIRRFSSIRI